MMQQNRTAATINWDQIGYNTTVFDQAGEKLGRIAEVNQSGGYLVVEKGWLFPKDFYVPTNAIERMDDDGIYLLLSKDALSDAQYDNPPTAASMANWQTDQTVKTETVVRDAAWTDATETSTDGDIRIPVREEELVVGKREEEEGRVHIHKDVVEEQQTVSVPLQREQVTVERVAWTGDVTNGDLDNAFTERTIDVPVMGEEVVVDKRVRGVEEVRIQKSVVTETEQVSDMVRKERVVVDGVDQQGKSITNTVDGAAARTTTTVSKDASTVQNTGANVKDTVEGAAKTLGDKLGQAKDNVTGR